MEFLTKILAYIMAIVMAITLIVVIHHSIECFDYSQIKWKFIRNNVIYLKYILFIGQGALCYLIPWMWLKKVLY